MVFQRDILNKADIFIDGSFVGSADKVEARLIKLDSFGSPKIPEEATAWSTIVSCPQNGSFSGALFNQDAGWYNLEIKITDAGIQNGNSSLLKVGIGEVFVVSGQSNANGHVPNREPNNIYAPTDDRVNCINWFDETITQAPEMEFSHLEMLSFIAPRGETAWCWGAFGQAVSTNWDVPVLLFNTGIGNTGIFQWRASANGEQDPCGIDPGHCSPYYYLKKTLNGYAQKTGIRAILWHQGENDYGIFEGGDFPPDYYYSNLKQVISQSRTDAQNNVSWVIAKVSRVDDNTSARVTDGQQMVIDEPNFNTFPGPLSDNIQPSGATRDLNHFWGYGLVDLGNAWFNSINNANFFANSTPYKGKFNIFGCSSVKSGDWNDPATWSSGKVPTVDDDVYICVGQFITLNSVAHLKGLKISGSLQMGALADLQFSTP